MVTTRAASKPSFPGVVTNIGLDHVEWLGDTVEKIAAEKAGILRPRVPVVTAAEVHRCLNAWTIDRGDFSTYRARIGRSH